MLDCVDGSDFVGAAEGGRAHFAEADVFDFAFTGAGQLKSYEKEEAHAFSSASARIVSSTGVSGLRRWA